MVKHDVIVERTTLAVVKLGGGGTTCSRCRGFLVPSTTDSQLLEITEHPTAPAWRCVNCGDWVDATVAANRNHAGGRDGSVSSSQPLSTRRRWRW